MSCWVTVACPASGWVFFLTLNQCFWWTHLLGDRTAVLWGTWFLFLNNEEWKRFSSDDICRHFGSIWIKVGSVLRPAHLLSKDSLQICEWFPVYWKKHLFWIGNITWSVKHYFCNSLFTVPPMLGRVWCFASNAWHCRMCCLLLWSLFPLAYCWHVFHFLPSGLCML